MPGQTVKDVPSHAFVKEYAAHLKRTGKVSKAELFATGEASAWSRANSARARKALPEPLGP